MVQNPAILLAKEAHARFAAGDSDGVIELWDENIVHTAWAPTADEPWMGVFNGIEEGKRFLSLVAEMKPKFSFTDISFVPVNDFECLQFVETTLTNGTVLNEMMHWKINEDGKKFHSWTLYGDPLAHRNAKEGKTTTHEYFLPRHQPPPSDCKEGSSSAKDIAKLCHESFAVGDVDSIVSIWDANIIHFVTPSCEEIKHSGVHVGKDQGLEWLGNYAQAGIKYQWVEETAIELNHNMCFTFAIATYKDGTKGCECMRWITKDGKLISWTCFGNTIVHAK